jgi:gamma-glutamyltranspeptidase/glutathione hydrolase
MLSEIFAVKIRKTIKPITIGLALMVGLAPVTSYSQSSNTSAIIRGDSRHHPKIGKYGMVASQHKIASRVGAKILADGGNAIDAAVAVGFALAVVLPRAGNLGGGGFMIVHLAETGENIAIDYREMGPKAAHPDMYLDANGNVDQAMVKFSHKAAGVPGTVMGMTHALEKYGSMSLKEVIAPAIKLAEGGFGVTFELSQIMKSRMTRFSRNKAAMDVLYKKYGSGYVPYDPGEILKQPDLAKTLKRISDNGSDGFYKGETANMIVKEMQSGGGIITHDDLTNYVVRVMEPVQGKYRGHDIISMPPPSSGGVHVLQMLNVLENYDLKSMGFGSADTIHVMAEAMKYAYADRSEHLGDPAFHAVPVKWLISKKYSKEIIKNIDMNKARPSNDINPGKPSPYESQDTTHYSVMDAAGNAVVNTYTLNFSFGSGIVVDGAGFFLNNEMDDFSAKPNTMNGYGLLGGIANQVDAGKRPLSSMTPTMVLKNGKPVLLTGSPGGSRIITTVLQSIINVVDHGMNVAEAIHVPRMHHQWKPEQILMEDGFSQDTIKALEAKGHKLRLHRILGSIQAIATNGLWQQGASDPRRPDAAAIGVCVKGKVGNC